MFLKRYIVYIYYFENLKYISLDDMLSQLKMLDLAEKMELPIKGVSIGLGCVMFVAAIATWRMSRKKCQTV